MATHTHTDEQPRRIGFRRWIFLGVMVLGAFLALGVRGIWTPISPVVVLQPEPFMPGAFITNTMASLAIGVAILLAMGLFVVQPYLRSGKEVPDGLYQVVEVIIEFWWNTTQSTAGKYAREIFPIVATIFFVVLSANLVKLIPIHETIGYTKAAHGNITGYDVEHIGPFYILNGDKATKPADRVEHGTEGETKPAEGAEAAHGEEKSSYNCTKDCEVVPMFRGAATDLNFTFTLAIIAMFMVQFFGVRALGLDYFSKFLNFKTIIQKPFFGLMDTIVGLLELLSEVAKVLSFGLRLFGTIFAGTLLLGIVGVLVPVLIPGFLFGLETFVGLLQAYVFATLALTFMSQATVSHHGDDHGDAH